MMWQLSVVDMVFRLEEAVVFINGKKKKKKMKGKVKLKT
jgi:hypothetical protein